MNDNTSATFYNFIDVVTIGFDQRHLSVVEDGRLFIINITLVEEIGSPVSVEVQSHSITAENGQGIY